MLFFQSFLTFCKVFFLNLGIDEATWHGVQKDGIQITPQNFDEILAVAATQVEHVLKVMTSTFALDQFLIDHFSLGKETGNCEERLLILLIFHG